MKIYLLIVLIPFVCLKAIGQYESGFEYIESSNGMSYPEWESGKTELEFADINMDGYVDILSIGDHGCPNINSGEEGIMVWFGDGQGNWSVQMTGDFGYGGIAIGDVNNDGHWDVGYGMHHAYSSTDLGDQLIEVALGDGSGTNWTAWDDGLATNGEDWGMFGTDFADVDNDGDLDIGSNSFGAGSGLHVYINKGDGTWEQSFGIMEGNSNMRFVFGDINNDGNADFVVTHDAGIAFFGNGDGTFYNADYNLPQYSFPMSGPDLGDIDKNGGKDLAYSNPDGGISVWVFDDANNQWIDKSESLPSTGDYQEVQLCDLNTDGTLDIAAFGDGVLTVWKGISSKENNEISWEQVFNTTTSNNGDCSAFRVGGDVDRNGYPDMTLVQKEGSWPSDQNYLKCYKESSPLFLNRIKAMYPKGSEVFKQGSVQFTDWVSGVPVSSTSEVKIEYSLKGKLGPFTLLTSGTANSGRYQWTIPNTVSTNNCYLRYTLYEGDDTLISKTNNAFTILGEDGVEADFTSDSTVVYPNSHIQFTDQSLGLLTSWEWDFDNDGTIDATERNPVYEYTEKGLYTVKLTVSDGNNNDTEIKTDYIEVLSPVNISEYQTSDIVMSLFPNPAGKNNFVFIEIENPKNDKINTQDIDLMIFDINGQKILEQNDYSYHKTKDLIIDVSMLRPGIYFCQFISGNKNVVKKLIIR